MGVSFKVSKTGTRFRPKPLATPPEHSDDGASQNSASNYRDLQIDLVEAGKNITQKLASPISSEPLPLTEREVSFTLNLFPDGYSVGSPFENEISNRAKYQDFPKLLHPYDRSSESLFLAIESGHLPGDILDDIPAKYVDGALVCEVRDYRRCSSDYGAGALATNTSTVNKVYLKLTLENIVKDIPSITDKSWTYGDIMEVESKILKAVEPQLHLDPSPKLDRLCESPDPPKLNLNLSNLRRKRLRLMPNIAVTSTNKTHGNKVCIDRVPESSNSRFVDSGIVASTAIMQQTLENPAMQNFNQSIAMTLRPKSFIPDSSVLGVSMMCSQSRYQMEVGTPRSMQEHGSVTAINASGASLASQDVLIPYADNANTTASLLAKRDNQDGQTLPLSNLAKRMRYSAGVDAMQQHQMGTLVEALQGSSDMNWQNTLLQQAMARGVQYVSSGIKKFPQQVLDMGLNQDKGTVHFSSGQQSMGLVAKEEQVEMDKLDGPEINRKCEMEMDTSNLDAQQLPLQQRLPQAFMRPNFPQTTWNNLGQHTEKDTKKEDQLRKRKKVQSPRLSNGTLPHSPLSTKSGDFSNGSVGPSFGQSSVPTIHGGSQKEKAAMGSLPATVGTPCLTSAASDSAQRQLQAQLAAKRRSNSLPKTPAMNGVGSPASVGNGVPSNVNSPTVSTSALIDQGLQNMLDRFSKIDMVTTRHQLDTTKNKVDGYSIQKQNTYSPQHVAAHLANATNNEGLIDETSSLSKSLLGGSMNVCKMRSLSFCLPEPVVQGNVVRLVSRLQIRMIMSEKPSDGTVAMHYGDIDEKDFMDAIDCLPTSPNTHFADLLANQFCSQMAREGYVKEEDRIQIKPDQLNLPSGSQSIVPVNNLVVEMQQYGEPIPGQSSKEAAKAASNSNASFNLSQNLIANPRMLTSGNPQTLQMSQGLLSSVSMAPRPQQLDLQQAVPQHLQQNQQTLIQQKNPQFQGSMMLGTNHLSHFNTVGKSSSMPLGNHMLNKSSPLQIQMLQQTQQQQQQPQMQRKMMMGLGPAVNMGNLRNSIVGIGLMGNSIGMGAASGIGGAGISAPMTPLSSIGNLSQNPMSFTQASNFTNVLNQHLRSGQITQTQAELLQSKYRMSRSSMSGSPLSSIASITGTRQIHPGSASGLSMVGQSLSRANMSTLQRPIGPMGPPKQMAGMNPYTNQPQQHQPQQLQLHQQQLQQQLQQQQQEPTSQLQAVVPSPQVGLPSTMGVAPLKQQPQQQASPQQMSQRTPMSPQQMSSGTIHGNPEACPASPQLSSQTLGSVSSMTNSPMDMQGVNKSNSVSDLQWRNEDPY